MEIYLLRHTRVHNPHKLCYGSTEMILEDTFQTEALAVKKNLISFVPDRVFTSESERTRALALFLGYSSYKKESTLNELDFGDWEQKKWADIPERQLNRWMYNYVDEKAPKGESYEELSGRVRIFLQTQLGLFWNGSDWDSEKSDSLKKILIISHAGPIRCFLSFFWNINAYQAMQWQIPEGGIWKIRIYPSLKTYITPPLL